MALTTLTRGEVNEEIAAAHHKDLAIEDDALDVTRFRKNAFAFLEWVHPWWFLHAHSGAIALAANTYAYGVPTGFVRVDRDTVCVYDTTNVNTDKPLTWCDEVAEIDRLLGRGWKRTGHAGGEPTLAAMVGATIMVGPAPSTSWIGSGKALDYWYYKAIDPDYATVRVAAATDAATDTTAINAPPQMLPYISWASQQLGQLQEDNDAWGVLTARFRSEILPELRGFDVAVASYEPVARPRIRRRRAIGRRVY